MHPMMDSTACEDKQSLAYTSTGTVAESGPDADDIIAKYEEMFASRYTNKDPEYLVYINKGMDPPPVVENYHTRRPWQNRNDNSRNQRPNQGRGYKRSYGDASWQDGADRPKRQYDNRDSHHQGRGHRDQQWDQRQYWRGRGGSGQGSQPPWERRYDDRDRGGYSGSHEPGHGSHGRNSSRPNQDEWT